MTTIYVLMLIPSALFGVALLYALWLYVPPPKPFNPDELLPGCIALADGAFWYRSMDGALITSTEGVKWTSRFPDAILSDAPIES